MKKSFIYSLIILGLLLKSQISFGFLSDPIGLDMYKNVDKGIYDLEFRFTDRELKGGDENGSIVEELKKVEDLSKISDCYSIDFTTDEIKKIVTGDNAQILYQKLEKCEVNGALPSQTFAQYYDMIKGHYQDAVNTAEEKTKTIYEISRIGLYSDGIEENSPFDLIVDLQDINKIIFETEVPYNGVNLEDMGSLVDGILNGEDIDDALMKARYNNNFYFENKTKSGSQNPNLANIQPINIVDGNSSICKIDNSGLSTETLEKLLPTNSGTTNTGTVSNSGTNNNIDDIDYLDEEEKFRLWSYEKVDDSAMWPCSNFFCITVEFVTYSHKLLGWGKSRSIEGIINQSNKHLKKYSGLSLVQSRMTTNFFELGLKDLNLADTFHIGLQVSYKPVPILNMDKIGENDEGKKQDSDDFSGKSLLNRYYKNLGLEYERSNDLEIFKNEDNIMKSFLNKMDSEATEAAKSIEEFDKYREMLKLQNSYVSNTVINKKILQDDTLDFYNQFVELEGFLKTMMDYSISLNGIIHKMDEIPIGSR